MPALSAAVWPGPARGCRVARRPGGGAGTGAPIVWEMVFVRRLLMGIVRESGRNSPCLSLMDGGCRRDTGEGGGTLRRVVGHRDTATAKTRAQGNAGGCLQAYEAVRSGLLANNFKT